MNARSVWALTVAVAAGLFAAAAFADQELPGSLHALFWYTLLLTTACVLGALALLALAWRNGLAELGVLAAGLFTVSVLPMVHGLTLPGVLYGPNPTTMFSVLIALPAAVAVTCPLVGGRWGMAGLVLRRWKGYSTGVIGLVTVVAALLLISPEISPRTGPREGWVMALAAFGLVGALAVGRRHVDLYAVGRRPASLFAGIGWSFVGLASLVWFAEEELGLAVWAAHLFDGAGVLLAAGGLFLAHHRDSALVEVFAPVINRDPIIALRLGVTPQVDEFLASLRDKDAQTRGHVVRVAELAMTLGVRAGIQGERLRTLGLGALMHDIGKIRVDQAILTKAGPLTDAEFEHMKRHTVHGERMLAGDELLRPASRLVRSHHERVDGAGYPDGLTGADVGLDIGIIAVADAWDAMVQTRHYRRGMSEADARRILRDGAGAQWPTESVDLLLAELDDGWELRGVFTGLGWTDDEQVVCADILAGLV